MVTTLRFHCRVCRFEAWPGNWDPRQPWGMGSQADSSPQKLKRDRVEDSTAFHLKSNNEEDKDFLINVIGIHIFSKCLLPTNTNTSTPDAQPHSWSFPCQTPLLRFVSENKIQRRLACHSVAALRSTSVSEVRVRTARITFRSPRSPGFLQTLDPYKEICCFPSSNV